MSAKGDCGHHPWHERHHFFRRFFGCLLFLIILVLFIILVIYLVLRPTKPRFALQDATVLNFSLSSDPGLLTSTLQVTIASSNPNNRIGIYYDKLDFYASYKYQQITVATATQPSYQGHNDVSVWSPFLYGNSIPIAPYLSLSLGQDQSAGVMLLRIKIDGRVRWKVGSWTSGRYHLNVNCPAFLTFDGSGGKGSNGFASPSIKFRQVSTCTVDI